MNISVLAKASGTTTDALRHYEKLGLLEKPERAENAYRRYAASDVRRVQFIRSAQSLGFSLAEIGSIIPHLAVGQLDRTQIEEALNKKMAEIDAHMKALRRLRKDLQDALGMLACPREEPVTTASATRPLLQVDGLIGCGRFPVASGRRP